MQFRRVSRNPGEGLDQNASSLVGGHLPNEPEAQLPSRWTLGLRGSIYVHAEGTFRQFDRNFVLAVRVGQKLCRSDRTPQIGIEVAQSIGTCRDV